MPERKLEHSPQETQLKQFLRSTSKPAGITTFNAFNIFNSPKAEKRLKNKPIAHFDPSVIFAPLLKDL